MRKEEKGTCFKLVYFTDNLYYTCVAVPIEIEYYSAAYFKCIIEFDAL